MPKPLLYLAPLLCGALLTLSFAPFNLWPIGLLSLAGLYFCLLHKPDKSITLSWLFGFGQFCGGASWVYASIHTYGNAAVPLALLLVFIFCAGLALFYVPFGFLFKKLNKPNTLNAVLLFPILWVLTEWLRSWLATGFPWLYIGYGHLDSPLRGYLPVFGVYGASFFAALSVTLLLQAKHVKKPKLALFALGLWLIGGLMIFVPWTQPTGEPKTIAIVQPNFSLEEKWDRKNFSNVLRQLIAQTDDVKDADIVVWPESAIPARYHLSKSWVDHLQRLASENGYTLIAGQPYRDTGKQPAKLLNSQWVANPHQELQFYFKKHLVPFGEYVPFENKIRGMIDFFDLPSSHFKAGNHQQPALLADGIEIAMYICYEVAFPQLVASGEGDAKLLFTVSNDVWFGESIGPLQHYQIAATRAVELGKPMIRSTNNGISGVIDINGNDLFKLPSFETAQGLVAVQPYSGKTPYGRFGDKLILLLCLGLLSLLLRPLIKPA